MFIEGVHSAFMKQYGESLEILKKCCGKTLPSATLILSRKTLFLLCNQSVAESSGPSHVLLSTRYSAKSQYIHGGHIDMPFPSPTQSLVRPDSGSGKTSPCTVGSLQYCSAFYLVSSFTLAFCGMLK